MENVKRRTVVKSLGGIAGAAAFGFPHVWEKSYQALASSGDIEVGVLLSQTGPTAAIERPMSEAVKMALSEINEAGGLLGSKVSIVEYDPGGEPRRFSDQARRQIIRDQVSVILGCYTSASRIAVKPVVEQSDHLLVYCAWYEGHECSKNIAYPGGCVPNQQLFNSVPWCIENLGSRKVYIVGSDYVYPRRMAQIVKQLLEEGNASWVEDEYLPLGATDWATTVNRIRASEADLIWSNVVGDSIPAFYRELNGQGVDFNELPVMATVTTEIDVAGMGAQYAEGTYQSSPYFMSIDNEANRQFVKNFQEFTGRPEEVTHLANLCAYQATHMWARAVENAGSADPLAVRDSMEAEPPEFDSPQGRVRMDPHNLHAYCVPRIGQWMSDGQARIVDEYDVPIPPLPFAAIGETEDDRYCTTDGARA